MLSFASVPCALLPLEPALRNLHRGDASVFTKAREGAPQVPERCSIFCRAIQPSKLQGFACFVPAALFESCFGKPGVFDPRHRGTSSRKLTIHNSGSPAEIVLSNSIKSKKLALITRWKSPQLVEDFLTGESPSLPSCKRFAPDDING